MKGSFRWQAMLDQLAQEAPADPTQQPKLAAKQQATPQATAAAKQQTAPEATALEAKQQAAQQAAQEVKQQATLEVCGGTVTETVTEGQ